MSLSPREVLSIRRVLFVTYGCYLDDTYGAAIACRALIQTLAHRRFVVEVLSSPVLDLGQEVEPDDRPRPAAARSGRTCVTSAGRAVNRRSVLARRGATGAHHGCGGRRRRCLTSAGPPR
jgi:hypothetical protein